MAINAYSPLATLDLFRNFDARTTTREYADKETIYLQGDRSDAMFFIRSGYVKLTVKSKNGKKAIIALLYRGDFFGEGCLAQKSLRTSTATALETSSIARITRASLDRSIHREPVFAKIFISHLIHRIGRIQEEFAAQVLDPSEKRLARVLLTMAGFDQESRPKPVLLKISQETLAQMVGTTRSRVSFFMNRFRERGFIDYNGTLQIHPSLLTLLTDDS
jgi:CRP/FNR family transcriptional regulator, cyclic AMP receptor protein